MVVAILDDDDDDAAVEDEDEDPAAAACACPALAGDTYMAILLLRNRRTSSPVMGMRTMVANMCDIASDSAVRGHS